jgi:putative uncharacterized protein (fragment)
MERAISFWDFLNRYNIEIPIIQRDYAQGRKGKETLREMFLRNLKNAMDNNLSDKQEILILDFVYGSVKNGKLQPLDGQQRLTTLWLLHWYVALRAKKMEEAGMLLQKFSYETRMSSRNFFKNLCYQDFNAFVSREDSSDESRESIVDFITNQIWFYAEWKQDPTIQSVLRMLSGTDMNDGIEELFGDEKQEDFEKYWEKLTSANAPIKFYYLPMNNFNLTDDLYIKMNARGKQLTHFENFKADLVGYIEENQWKDLTDPEKGIPIKMDTTWMDIFWKAAKGKNRVDEIYFEFLNRFFLNYHIGKIEDASDKYYSFLTKKGTIRYEGLKNYMWDNEIDGDLFVNLERILDNFSNSDIKKDDFTCDWDKTFRFIPEYNQDSIEDTVSEWLEVSSITQLQRVVFYAICKYFKEGEADTESLRRWMRFVWNIVSVKDKNGNERIQNLSEMKKAIDIIDKVKSPHNVYSELKYLGEITPDNAFERQLQEEIEKAKRILTDDNSLATYKGACKKTNGEAFATWEEIIIEAERYAFFNGAIRFLFRDKDGKFNWNDFDKKWTNVKKYFKEENVKKDTSAMRDNYDNANLLKSLISRITVGNFEEVLWNNRVFNNFPQSWRYYLMKTKICYSVHELLCGNEKAKELKSSTDFAENTIYLLSNTGLLDFVVENIPYSWIRNYHDHKAIYPSSKGIFLDAEYRDRFLLDNEDITIYETDIKIVGNREFFWGSDINFEYEGHNYQWYRDDRIYLMLDDNPDEYAINTNNRQSDNTEYYYFKYDKNINIKDELKNLYTQFSK